LPIAIDSGMSYEAVSIVMQQGDVAVLYTDGINESMNSLDELFSIERVRDLVAEGGGAKAISDRIVQAVAEFVGDGVQEDDMCIVVIERTKNAKPHGINETQTLDFEEPVQVG